MLDWTGCKIAVNSLLPESDAISRALAGAGIPVASRFGPLGNYEMRPRRRVLAVSKTLDAEHVRELLRLGRDLGLDGYVMWEPSPREGEAEDVLFGAYGFDGIFVPLSPPRTPAQILTGAAEPPGLRQLRGLLDRGRIAEAFALASRMFDDDLLSGPTETLADRVRRTEPALAERLYELAARFYELQGQYATGSGEGLMSVTNSQRIERKRRRLVDDRGGPHAPRWLARMRGGIVSWARCARRFVWP